MRCWSLLLVASAASVSAGPLRLIVEELLDVGADLVDSVSDLLDNSKEARGDDEKIIGLASVTGCAKYNNKCKNCLKTSTCNYCEVDGECL